MIPLSPLLSWALLITLGLCAGVAAVAVARWFDAAEDERSMRQWREMRDALDLHDWKEDDAD